MKNILFALFFLLTTFSAEAEKYYFKHYQNENGLSHNTVVACLQDTSGFMWFGTKNGLNRFDGIQFKKYYTGKSDNSIPNNAITTLREDKHGLIWIGTYRGLCCYNPSTDIFQTFKIKGKPIKSIIRDIQIDLQNNIWFATSKGIYRYDINQKRILYFPSNIFFVPNKILITHNGEIWITSKNGKIYKYFDSNHSFRGYQILTAQEMKESINILKVIEDNKQQFYIATSKAGVRLFDPITKSVRTLFNTNDEGLEMVVNDMLITKDNEIWIGASNGLYKYNPDKGLSHAIRNNPGDPFSISDNGVFALWEDNEKGIWACTYYGGINYLPHENTFFEKYVPSSMPGHIQGKVIRTICCDNSGKLWIGSEDQGLSSYNPNQDFFTNYPFHQNIRSLIVKGSTLWLGTSEHGIYSLDFKSNKITQRIFKNLKSNTIVSFLQTHDHTIYVATSLGLYQYIPMIDDMKLIEDKALQKTNISCLCESSDGELWIGTYGNGLFVYNRKKQKSIHYTYSEESPTSVSSDFITSLFEDSKQQIWITTEGGGFCKFNRNRAFIRFQKENGLPSNITCAISEDAKGFLWISSMEGLIRFNPTTASITIYNTSNGLLDNNFSYNSHYVDENGKMYFGTIKGMIAFNPFEIKDNKITPPIYITGFHVLDSEKEITEKGKSILKTHKIELPYNKSSFYVDFVAPTYTNPKLNKYRYILEGYDQNWHYLTDYRKIYYTNVAPGTYKLKIAIMDSNNDWNSRGIELIIKITPPYWNSIWAHLLYIILIGAILTYIYKKYTQKKAKEHIQIINELNNQKEKELYNSKIHFFTNITHEVRTPLTLIKIPLDKMINSKKIPDCVKENLDIMKRNVDRLLDLINQLLDFRKTEMDMLKLNYMRMDICSLIKNIVDRFQPSAEDLNKTLHYYQPKDPIELAIDKEIITKIISNLLTNALKYSKDLIEVSIESSNDMFFQTYIRINSNGDLIPENLREKIFEPFYQIEQFSAIHTQKGTGLGLSLARSLADLHQGKLYIDSTIHNMNSFVLALSNQQKENVKIKSVENESPQIEAPTISQLNDNRPIILIVDDEKEMTKFIANELSSNYNTMIAYNGNQAVEILKKEQINLVVSDVLMPVMDGYALCNYIKSTPDICHIPVILLTASVAINSRIAGLESGADGYIEKPFTMKLLIEQINNIFRNKELACKNFISSPLSNYRTIALNNMDKDFMKKLHSVILANMSDSDFKVEKLTGLMNMSRSSLFRKIKAITDLAPNEYIRLYKLKKAAELLVEGNYKINEVAYIVGFSSQSYFTISFQKQFNISPTEFIKQQKKEEKQI